MRWNVTKFSGALLSTILAVSAWPSSPIAAPAPQTPANEFREVDVALVLAIDMSGSIDYQEADLQRRGIADALMNKEVIAAIQSGSLGRIGISAVYFSSRQYGVMSVPVNWMIINDAKSAETFVKTLVAAPRGSARGTSISDALELSWRMLERGPYHAVKQVIDVSGDGVNNAGRRVLEVRDEILAKGVTINALPIIDDQGPSDLDKYFEGCVIGGPASFVIPANGFADFGRALRRKLILEISGLTPNEQPQAEPRIIRAAATPARPNFARPAPKVNPPYPAGCDFPMFGGFYGGGFRQ